MIPFAIDFELNNDLNDEAAEFNILFYPNRNKIENLIEFVQEYEDRRINIKFPDGIHMPTLKSINKVSDNIYVRLMAQDIYKLNEIKENNIKFFFDVTLPAYNFTNLDSYIKMGVSDVYIADDLCYCMDDVKKTCDNNDVKLRIVLNHIPATSFDKGINEKSPIYMPKDYDMLSQYYSVFEFDCGTPCDWAKFDVLYKAWYKNHYWHGEMYEINEDVQQNFNCDLLYPKFTKFKLNCGRRCDSRWENHCRKCQQFLSLGETLKTKGVRFTN